MQLQIREEFGQDAKISLLLHPPILRSLGMQNKIAFGPGSRWIIRLLAVARKLRGTPFDIFGYAHVRRVERELIEEYSQDMHWAIEHLNSRTHDSVVKLASLPDVIRGYEFIKLDNVELYRAQRAELREEIALKFSSTESISH
jgi:indolepyruvate ferredoxin oxidoreductase